MVEKHHVIGYMIFNDTGKLYFIVIKMNVKDFKILKENMLSFTKLVWFDTKHPMKIDVIIISLRN